MQVKATLAGLKLIEGQFYKTYELVSQAAITSKLSATVMGII